MLVHDSYSKKQNKLCGEGLDIFIYDHIPLKLRTQIVQIIQDAIGKDTSIYSNKAQELYKFIYNTFCRRHGIFKINEDFIESYQEQLFNCLLKTESFEEAMDIIELSFSYIYKIIKGDFYSYKSATQPKIEPDEAIKQLNDRFKENGIGYSFVGYKILRIDSEYTHKEITKPTITFLTNKKFKAANEEYLKAHEYYRFGRNKESLTECLNSFESTMKTICKEKKWDFNKTDSSKKLIQICLTNNLAPSCAQNQFTSLQNLLESGIPKTRNKSGGQSNKLQKEDDEMTRYGLNLTGTNIIFLIGQSGIK